jgi:hypothetical protein
MTDQGARLAIEQCLHRTAALMAGFPPDLVLDHIVVLIEGLPPLARLHLVARLAALHSFTLSRLKH